MTPESGQKLAWLICFVVISIAVVGYFVGLQSPMNPSLEFGAGDQPVSDAHDSAPVAAKAKIKNGVVPSSHYSEMGAITRESAGRWQTSLVDLKSNVDLLAEIIVTPEQKDFALSLREQNRAFNGAPPTVPHPVDQMSAQSCIVCHGEGIKTESLTISKMSHQFLENCTQCHVENNPTHMAATLFRESTFVGLPAPTGGPRAYEGAPPMIPHSTWMRVDCMSCHGPTGKHGIRSTHPWRQSCQQCHAPSSVLDQIQIESTPKFLPPPPVR